MRLSKISRLWFMLAMLLISAPHSYADGVPDPTQYNIGVDFPKIRFWAGEGSNEAAFIYQCISWGASSDTPNNLVFGYRWDGEAPTVKKMLEDISRADERFVGLAFDGDDILSFGYDNYKGLTSMMRRKSQSWLIELYNANSEKSNDYKPVTNGASHRIENGETVLLRCAEENKAILVTYLLYRPAKDETGVFIPEEMSYYHENNGVAYIPAFVNLGGNLTDYTVSGLEVTALRQDESLSPSLTTNGYKFDESKCFEDFPLGSAELYMSIVYSNDNNGENSSATLKSNNCCMEIKYPARPLVALSYEYQIYSFPEAKQGTINKTAGWDMALTLQPADATYTIGNRTCTGSIANRSKAGISIGPKNTIICLRPSGESDITYTSVLDPEVTATAHVVFGGAVNNPVTDINIDEIRIPYRHIWGKIGDYIVPQDATIKDLYIKEIEDPSIVGFYSVTQDLISYQAGETYVTFESRDGGGYSKRIKVIVEPPVRYDGDFQDGFFVMNEGWFDHASTSLNFFPRDGEPYYNAFAQMNEGLTIAGTGVGGYYWGDRIYIANYDTAKDEQLPGVENPVLDAMTLGMIEGKKSVGGAEGVGIDEHRIASVSKKNIVLQDIVDGAKSKKIDYDEELPGVIGCVKAGKYLFVASPDCVVVIDPETEEQATTIKGFRNGKKMVQSADGNVWIMCADKDTGTMVGIDPANLELFASVDMPYAAGFNTSYLWYHATRFFASPNENVIFWLHKNNIYRWDISDSSATARVAVYNTGTYGGPSIDPVRNQILLLVGGTGYPGRYVYNVWYDPSTGEQTRSDLLAENYWFPSMAIYPSRYLPEINLDEITAKNGSELEIDLAEYLHDADPGDLDFNILPTLRDAGDPEVALVTLDQAHRTLKVVPVKDGKTAIKLGAMSRGNLVEREIPVTVSESSAVGAVTSDNGFVAVNGRHLSITGHAGETFRLITPAGTEAERFDVTTDAFAATIKSRPGIYLLVGAGKTDKVVIR